MEEEEKAKDGQSGNEEEELNYTAVDGKPYNSLKSFRTTAVLNPVRKIISKDRIRFKAGNIDLDLTYITPEVVAMGFPASGIESAWRNHIDDVAFMLEQHHHRSYMIWNLSDKRYDYSKFSNNIKEFGFPDHHSPPLDMLFKIVLTMSEWITASDSNVAVVHCVGGKGRTGTVIACYLNFSGLFDDPIMALEHFAFRRSKIENGVKQPSQRRYVLYFHEVLSKQVRPYPKTLLLARIVFNTLPVFEKKVHASKPLLQVWSTSSLPGLLLYSSAWVSDTSLCYASDGGKVWDIHTLVKGDTLIRCTHIGNKKSKLMFRFSFHTAFINQGKLRLTKSDLDGIKEKDCTFDDDFFVDLFFKEAEEWRVEENDSYQAVYDKIFENAPQWAKEAKAKAIESPPKPDH